MPRGMILVLYWLSALALLGGAICCVAIAYIGVLVAFSTNVIGGAIFFLTGGATSAFVAWAFVVHIRKFLNGQVSCQTTVEQRKGSM